MKKRTKIMLIVSIISVFLLMTFFLIASQGDHSAAHNAILNGKRINVDGGYIEGHELTAEEWEEIKDGWSGS